MITYGSTTLTSYNTITNIEVYYYKSTSATSLSGGSWSTTKPTWENGKYIWQKIRTTYEGKLENGLYYSESDPVNITGQQGATGTAAYSYKLNASDTIITKSEKGEYSVSKITFTSTSKQGTNNVNAYAGRFKIETTANGTTWTTRYPTSGTGVDESSKEYTIPTDIIAIRCSLYQSGGFSTLLDIMTIPIINDGVGMIDPPYKEVEWVESTGKQYVYLDWKPPIKTWGFEVDFMSQNAVNTTAGGWNESTNKNGYGTIFGVRNSSGVNNAQLTSYNSGLLRIGNSTAIATAFKTDHSRQTIKLHGTTLTRANGVTATVTRVDETTGKPYCNMAVFGLYEGLRRTSTGNITEPSSTRIYSLKFYDGDTLAVDLVGSIRKADGITGLYDKVSKHFYPAPGMLFGNEVGDITNIDTVADSLNKADVSTTVVNKNRTRMWETSVPFNRLEDGQKITVTYSYGNVVNSTQTSELVGWDDTSSNSNVYLRLTYPDGTKSEWIPCYYSQTARLTTHYGAGTAIIFTYRENLLSNATETTGGSAIVRGFFANASYYQNTSYTQYSNNVKAGTNGIKGYTLIMKDSEDTWSCFYSGAYKVANTGKPVYTGGFILGKILYSAGAGAQTSNSSLDTYYNYKSGVNTSTIYDAYPVDLRYSTNCASTLTSQRPVYIVGTIENDGLFHLDVSQWYTQTEPTYADGKVYVYVGIAYSTYQVWLSTENPAYMFYNGEFILYDKAQTLQNINTLKNSLETQIDNKVETWCQKTNPANSWSAEERPNHTGDLWYYIGESGTTYKNNTTYQYNGETNVWSAYSANPDLFDKIDGKTAIYYGTTSSVTSAEEGDYLVDSENDCTYRWNNGAWVLATDYKQVAIDAIEIGGRNLFGLGSDCATSLSGMKVANFSIVTEDGYKCAHATGALKTTAYLQSNIPFTPKPLEKVVFSADVKIKDIVLGTTNPMCELYFSGQTINGTWRSQKVSNTYVDGELVATGNSKFHLILPSNEWHRVTVKWQFTDAEFTANMPPAIYLRDCTGELFVKNIKYERGTQETDWTFAPEDTQADIDTALAQSVEYIIGTQTAATGNWTGVSSSLTELKDGTQIRYWLPYAGSGDATLNLTLKDGTSTGAIPIYRQGGSYNTTSKIVVANRVTTHFPAGTSISMVYGVNRIVSAVSSSVTYTGTFTGWFADGAYDSGNTYNRTRMQNAITAATAITAGRIICGTSSGYKNIGANIAFDLSYPLLYASSAITATKTGDNNYLQINGINASNNGTITSGGANKTLYLKGTVIGNTFTISASPFMTTVVPTSADGFYYIPLGLMSSATAIYFNSSNRLYAYIDGAFQPVDTAAVLRAQDAKDRATAVYGTCSTGATTVDKVVTCSNFTLFDGARIQITFTNANTAIASEATTASPTLNVNGTGRKPIKIGIEEANTANPLYWAAGATIEFVYDGSAWVLQNAPYTLYGTCNTEENVREKQVVCDGAVVCKGTTIYVDMLYSNTADSNSENGNVTLNVANTIAKTIYANNATLTIRSRYNWNAGENPSFTFDGQYWQMDKDTVPAYITDKDEDGIFVHPINDTTSGWSIGKVFELLNNGYSYIKMWLEDVTDNLSAKIRIGREDQHHILLDKEIIQFKKGDTPEELASFSSSGISFDDGVPFKIGNDSTYVQFVDNNSDGVADALEIVADKISFKNGGDDTAQDIQERFNDLQTDISNITNSIEINPTADTPYVAITTQDAQNTNINAGLKLEPTQLSFQLNGQTTATMANDEMNIPTASVTNLFMQSANQSYEKIWVMRSNGHLSLKVGKQN